MKDPLDKPGVRAALERGEPLANVVIEFADGVDCVGLTTKINEVDDDVFVYPRPWYTPRCRLAVATKPALQRQFGYLISRVPHPSGGYWWEVVSEPQQLPEGVASMGLSQPGHCDAMQPWEW